MAVWKGKVLTAMQVHRFVLSDLCDIFQVHFKDMDVGGVLVAKILCFTGWMEEAD